MANWRKENRICVFSKSPIGDVLNFIFRFWAGLTGFRDDGRVELDSNSPSRQIAAQSPAGQWCERTIRPFALNRKNALFAGHGAGARKWAFLASMIETCKMNAVDTHAWLTQMLCSVTGLVMPAARAACLNRREN